MGWSDWEKAIESGPEAVLAKAGCCFVVLGVPLLLCLSVIGCGLGWFSSGSQVVRDELGPKVLLRKYSWFKDAAAELDARKASIAVYDKRFARLKTEYEGKSRSAWSREDREQANLWEQEAAGLRASYNRLAAEYNAALAKEHWRFCEVGRLPAGASAPLPREFKPYEEK